MKMTRPMCAIGALALAACELEPLPADPDANSVTLQWYADDVPAGGTKHAFVGGASSVDGVTAPFGFDGIALGARMEGDADSTGIGLLLPSQGDGRAGRVFCSQDTAWGHNTGRLVVDLTALVDLGTCEDAERVPADLEKCGTLGEGDDSCDPFSLVGTLDGEPLTLTGHSAGGLFGAERGVVTIDLAEGGIAAVLVDGDDRIVGGFLWADDDEGARVGPYCVTEGTFTRTSMFSWGVTITELGALDACEPPDPEAPELRAQLTY